MQIFKSTDQNNYSWVEQRRLFLGNSDRKLFAEITHQGEGPKLALIEIAVLRRKISEVLQWKTCLVQIVV